MLVIAFACFALALLWLPLVRKTEPTRTWLVAPWQRWSTYGRGALVLVVAEALSGVIILIMWAAGAR